MKLITKACFGTKSLSISQSEKIIERSVLSYHTECHSPHGVRGITQENQIMALSMVTETRHVVTASRQHQMSMTRITELESTHSSNFPSFTSFPDVESYREAGELSLSSKLRKGFTRR